MSRTPASNVMLHPKAHGLVLVREFFGVVRPEPRDLVAVSGDMVQDGAGKVSYFVGMDASRKPVLADTKEEYEAARAVLEATRCHSEFVHTPTEA
jgi:3',5'-cyclic AMP phosphodiesterase CpdA